MKENALIEILTKYKEMSNEQKLAYIQKLEKQFAEFQGRKPRTVKTEDTNDLLESIDKDREADAYYDRGDSKNIYVFGIENFDKYKIATKIGNVGFNAYIDDCINGEATPKFISRVDEEMFRIEEENLPAIHQAFEEARALPLFDSFYAEQRLNYREIPYTICKIIMDSLENKKDAETMFTPFVMSLFNAVENENRGEHLENEYGMTYDQIVTNALNKNQSEDEKIDLSKLKKFQNATDPEFLGFIEQVYDNLYNLVAKLENGNLNEEQKNFYRMYYIEYIRMLYNKYVSTMLNSKKKD